MSRLAEDNTIPLQKLVRLGIRPLRAIPLRGKHRRVQRPPALRSGRRGAAAAEVRGLIVHAAQRLALMVGLRAAVAVAVRVCTQRLQ